MKTHESFGVHWDTSHIITSDHLLVTYKYLTEIIYRDIC